MMNYCRTFIISKILKTTTQIRSLSNQVQTTVGPSSEIVIKQETNNSQIEEANDEKEFWPSYNFAAYANDSELLRNLVDLGVNLSKLEKKRGVPEFLLKLDFERDVKKYLQFFDDLGVPAEAYGHFLTKNPLIFKESIDDLETRIYYLQSKNFNLDSIQRIVTGNPYWLSFSTKRIDRRLGWFQKNFYLTGNELREVAGKCPKLITYNLNYVKCSTFSIREEMGFGRDELKTLLVGNPVLWTVGHEKLMDCFDLIHNVIGIPHEKIVESPEVLLSRRLRMEERYKFLKFLRRDQFDETMPGYVPLKSLTLGTDNDFVINICKSTPETFDNFLKTL